MRIRPLESFGIILSYKCSSRCRHCLYCCSNAFEGWMEPKDIERIIDGTRRFGGRIRGVHLAGGEAFLNFPLLLMAVQTLTRMGVPVDYVETNGHWFNGREDALVKLQALKDAGLDCIMVSASPQHAEYIPFKKTLGAIEACRAVFGSGGMFVWLAEFMNEFQGLGLEGTLDWDEYMSRIGPDKARRAASYGGQLVPGGRAGFMQEDHLPLRPAESWFGGTCCSELLGSSHGHYDLYGNLIPSSCAGLSLGDARDMDSLCSDFDLDDKPVLKALAEGGVRGLMAMAEKGWGFTPRAKGYAGKCHLCMDIRRHLVESGCIAPELSPRKAYGEIWNDEPGRNDVR